MFSEKDILQIERKGLTVQKVNEQIEIFKTGLPFVTIKDVATLGNGIFKLNQQEKQHYINYYDSRRENKAKGLW